MFNKVIIRIKRTYYCNLYTWNSHISDCYIIHESSYIYSIKKRIA